MPLFVAVHNWKPQDAAAIGKERDAAFAALKAGKTPKGVKLHYTWSADQRAFCVWEAWRRAQANSIIRYSYWDSYLTSS